MGDAVQSFWKTVVSGGGQVLDGDSISGIVVSLRLANLLFAALLRGGTCPGPLCSHEFFHVYFRALLAPRNLGIDMGNVGVRQKVLVATAKTCASLALFVQMPSSDAVLHTAAAVLREVVETVPNHLVIQDIDGFGSRRSEMHGKRLFLSWKVF